MCPVFVVKLRDDHRVLQVSDARGMYFTRLEISFSTFEILVRCTVEPYGNRARL